MLYMTLMKAHMKMKPKMYVEALQFFMLVVEVQWQGYSLSQKLLQPAAVPTGISKSLWIELR